MSTHVEFICILRGRDFLDSLLTQSLGSRQIWMPGSGDLFRSLRYGHSAQSKDQANYHAEEFEFIHE